MATREVKGFAGRLKRTGNSSVWIGGVNFVVGDKVRIVTSQNILWEGDVRALRRSGEIVKARASVEYKGKISGKSARPVRPTFDEDIADLTVTVGPPGETGSLDVPNVVIDGP